MTQPTNTSTVRGKERGIALVLSLFLMMAMSIVAASLMFLSQTETYSSMNYRLMSQARYGAESGIQKAANFLVYPATYTPPSTGGADSMANYNTTVSPVTYNGNPVTLKATAAQSNYPVSSVKTAFANAMATTLSAGTTSVNFSPTATLLSMEEVPAGNSVSGAAFTIQTWQIVSDGTIGAGSRTATVEVSAIIDTQKIASNSPSLGYSVFATAAGCGALQFSGGSTTSSYTMSGSSPVVANLNGNVGTNGNLTASGGAHVNGTLSTPRVGVGSCSSGNVDAETTSGGAQVCSNPGVPATCGAPSIVHLPQALSLAAPTIVNNHPPTTSMSVVNNTTCAVFALVAPATCSGVNGGSGLTIDPHGSTVNLGSLSTSGGATVTLLGGSYNINSINLSGGSTFNVKSGEVDMTVTNNVSFSGGAHLNIDSATSGALVMGIVNTTGVSPVVDLSGGNVSNPSYSSKQFQIDYAGTGAIKLSGGAQTAMVVYAPNAPITLSGGSDLYGELVASTLTDTGGAALHYDMALQNSGLFNTLKFQPGNSMMSGFSWKKQ
jgi:Tfp pilus assembly protein PilX